MEIRLTAYAPNGTALGRLPEALSLQVAYPRDDIPSATCRYSRLAIGGGILRRGLEQGLEVAAEVNWGGGWVEPRRSRFLLLKRTTDRLDGADVVDLTMPGYAWLLRKARALDTAHIIPDGQDGAGSRRFSAATPGMILGALLDENAARGGVPVAKTFTASADSAGRAWTQATTMLVPHGADLWTVLSSLSDQGMCDWETDGRALRLYVPDSQSRDLSSSIVLRPGRDLIEAPAEETLESVATRMLIRGDRGLSWVASNPTAPTPWGQWEEMIQQGGVSDEGTALSLAQSDLERASRVRGQYTRGLVITDETPRLPIRDYLPGDWITAPTVTGQERGRVQQITITRDGGRVGGSVVLHDRFVDDDLRRAKRLAGLTGSAASIGGNGSTPSTSEPPAVDTRTPKAPAGLLVATSAYMASDGQTYGQISAQWDAVTEATDGTSMEIAGYYLYARVDEPGAPWRQLTYTDGLRVDFSPLPPGQRTWIAVVAAPKYASNVSARSAAVFIIVGSDATPPPIPSDLVTGNGLGTIRLSWDGRGRNGETMPLDFVRLEIEKEGHAGIFEVLIGEGMAIDAGAQYLVIQRYRSRTVDRSGNESQWTQWVEGMAIPLVDADVMLSEIDASRTMITNAGQLAMASGRTLDEQLAYVQNNALGTEHAQVFDRPPVVADGTGRPPGVTWTQVDQDNKVIGYWSWSGTAWEAMPIAPGMIPKIDVGSGTFGNLEVSRLGASSAYMNTATIDQLWSNVVRSRKITTDMLVIGPGPNLVDDPNFEGGWSTWSASGPVSFATGLGRNGASGALLYHQVGASCSVTQEEPTAVQPGGKYRVSVSLNPPVSMSASQVWASVIFGRPNGQYDLTAYGPDRDYTLTPGMFNTIEWIVNCPADAINAKVIFGTASAPSGNYTLDFISVVKMTDASLIVDGAIQARHIVSGSITTEKLAAMAVSADKIMANSITTDKLAVGAVTSDRITSEWIDAKNIRGGIIEGAYISTGPYGTARGVKMSPQGIWAYNQQGAYSFIVDGNTGNVTASGVFTTKDAQGYGVSMSTTAYGDQAGISVANPTMQLGGALVCKRYAGAGYLQNDIVLHGPEMQLNSSGRAELVMSSGGNFRLGRLHSQFGGYSGFSYNFGTLEIKNLRNDGSADISLECNQHIKMKTWSGGITLDAWADISLWPNADLYIRVNRYTSSTQYIALESNFKAGKVGSVRALKDEIEDIDFRDVSLESVKKLRPRTWLDKGQLADGLVQKGDRVGRIPGFVAEEIDEIGGLEPFLCRTDGKLVSVAYDRMPAALVLWLREHEQRLKRLESTNG